jgi:hypothetical protein
MSPFNYIYISEALSPCVSHVEDVTDAYRILPLKPEDKRPHGRPRVRWEDNIKIPYIK